MENAKFLYKKSRFASDFVYDFNNEDISFNVDFEDLSIKDFHEYTSILPKINSRIDGKIEVKRLFEEPQYKIFVLGKNMSIENNNIRDFKIDASYEDDFLYYDMHLVDKNKSYFTAKLPINLKINSDDFGKYNVDKFFFDINVDDLNLNYINYFNEVFKIRDGSIDVFGKMDFTNPSDSLKIKIKNLKYNFVPMNIEASDGYGDITILKIE